MESARPKIGAGAWFSRGGGGRVNAGARQAGRRGAIFR